MKCTSATLLLAVFVFLSVGTTGCADDYFSSEREKARGDIDEEAVPRAQTSSAACANATTVDPKRIEGTTVGPYPVEIESDPAIPDYTIYRPKTLGGIKHPIVAWANGGCMKDGLFFGVFLREIAAFGYVVIADGRPGGGGPSTGAGALTTDGTALIKAIDLITGQNEVSCSKYYQKLDVSKVAVMGQSCGGLMAIGAGKDPRVSTVVMLNSGMFQRDQAVYKALHSPVAIFNGGPLDIAYAQGVEDFKAINHVPVVFVNQPSTGHGGTYWDPNGGDSAKITVAWLNWHLRGDQGQWAKGVFAGPSCELCKHPDVWTIEKKMID